jgi:hypothetical protein
MNKNCSEANCDFNSTMNEKCVSVFDKFIQVNELYHSNNLGIVCRFYMPGHCNVLTLIDYILRIGDRETFHWET